MTVNGGGGIILQFYSMIPRVWIRKVFRGFFQEDFAMTVVPLWLLRLQRALIVRLALRGDPVVST